MFTNEKSSLPVPFGTDPFESGTRQLPAVQGRAHERSADGGLDVGLALRMVGEARIS